MRLLLKLQRKFSGPYKILERIGIQAYRLKLPNMWRIHTVFHVPLLKQWRKTRMKIVPIDVELEDVNKPEYFEIEKNSTVALEFKNQMVTT